ncbi:MAG TPA: MBL fold metallo-hydrolase [Polyangiaceae bacterium]|jgi:glyoxylase-like metal-dependent hydrolase (beta-lactamase superfamily II)
MSLRTTFLATSFLVACSSSTQPSTDAGSDAAPVEAGTLTVETYSSASSGPVDIQVNSHIVLGPTEALVVDGQLLASDAQAVLQKVQASGRKLKTVFLTHAHPDHYAGLAVFTEAVPDVAVVTTPDVLADFQASAPGTFQYLQSSLGSAIADKLVTPTALSGSSLAVDGITIQVLDLPNAGESAHGAALALPGGGLVSGDLVYDDVHLFLGECHADGWKTNLTAFEQKGFTTIYPGHGPSPVDASAFAATSAYIDGAIPILEAAKAGDAGASDAGDSRVGDAVSQIQAAFPKYSSNYLLGYSSSTFLDTNACP